MVLLKLRQTRVGSFMVDNRLDKMPPRRILSRQERQRMQELHNQVQLWAGQNLLDEAYGRFYQALDATHYDKALSVLMDAFHYNSCVTVWQRRQWEQWRANFDKGFIPE